MISRSPPLPPPLRGWASLALPARQLKFCQGTHTTVLCLLQMGHCRCSKGVVRALEQYLRSSHRQLFHLSAELIPPLPPPQSWTLVAIAARPFHCLKIWHDSGVAGDLVMRCAEICANARPPFLRRRRPLLPPPQAYLHPAPLANAPIHASRYACYSSG